MPLTCSTSHHANLLTHAFAVPHSPFRTSELYLITNVKRRKVFSSQLAVLVKSDDKFESAQIRVVAEPQLALLTYLRCNYLPHWRVTS